MKFNVKAFALAVVLSVIFVSAKNIYSCELSSQADKGLYRALKLGTLDNLYIGSSMFRKGITLYHDNTSSFLIYYNGLDPVTESIILEYLFRNGLTVRNLYVDMYAYSAVKDSWPSDMRLMFDSPLELKLAVWRQTIKNPKAEYFPASWELLVKAENDMFILWPLYNRLIASRYCKGGYSADTFNHGMTPETAAFIKAPSPSSAKMNEAQKLAIVRIIELCRKYNVNVIFAETPKYEAVSGNAEYNSLMAEYLELLKGYGVECIMSQRTLENIKAVKGENISVYDFPYGEAALFEDAIHLSTEGSRKFMNALRNLR